MGIKLYVTGKPCKHGHFAARHVISGQCTECLRLKPRRTVEQEKARRKRRKARAATEKDFGWLKHKALRRRKKGGSDCATKDELRALWLRQKGCCKLTGAPIPAGITPHLDHIVPVSKGGTNASDNLQWVHPMANHAKGVHTVEEFEDWLLAAADALRARRQLKELI